MDDVKQNEDLLFAALDGCDRDGAMRVLSNHPELINVRRKDYLDQDYRTPLIEACKRCLQEVVKFLLDNGADVTATGYINFPDRQVSFSSRDVRTNIRFCRGGFGSLDGVFPLFAAAYVDAELVIIRTLLSSGADVNQKTATGQTALHAMCSVSNGHQLRELSELSLDDDDDYFGHKLLKAKKIKALINYGADVNACDDYGKCPLHYAAATGQNILAKILVRNGADVYLKDKLGLTALEYAAIQNNLLVIMLIENFHFPVEQIIQAYEAVALHAPYPSALLRKATLLREQHGIPKTVLPPLECYGFEKELETIEELEAHAENRTLLLHCLLARERISAENYLDIAQDEKLKVWRHLGQHQGKHLSFNSLLRHQLDRFSFFRNHLHFDEFMIQGSSLSLKNAYNYNVTLSSDVIVQFVIVAIDSCCTIQNQLNLERRPGFIREGIHAIGQTVVMVRVLIVHLIKRSCGSLGQGHSTGYATEFTSEFNHPIAKVLLEELFHRLPTVSASFCGYASPVVNLL